MTFYTQDRRATTTLYPEPLVKYKIKNKTFSIYNKKTSYDSLADKYSLIAFFLVFKPIAITGKICFKNQK